MPTELKNIDVRFISLVRAGANKRQIIWKSLSDNDGLGGVDISREVHIAKTDGEKLIVYGIVYAPEDIDTQGEFATASEIEAAAHRFMKSNINRNVDQEHDFDPKSAWVAESWIVRRGDPMFQNEPEGAWAVGIKIDDPDLWEEVKKGEIKGLSMAGTASKVQKAEDDLENIGIIRRLARTLTQFLLKEDEKMNREDIQKLIDDTLRPIRDDIAKVPKPHTDEELAAVIKTALDEKLNPILGRIEAVEKSTPGSAQDDLPVSTEDLVTLGRKIAKMI